MAQNTQTNYEAEFAALARENARRTVEEETVTFVLTESARVQPPSTKRSYVPKQGEFKSWCMEVYGSETVNEIRLLTFLLQRVKGRRQKRRGRRSTQTRREADGQRAMLIVKFGTIDSYVSAMVALWNNQSALRSNTFGNPRDDLVNELYPRLLKSAGNPCQASDLL